MPTMAGKAGSRSDGSGVRPGEDEEDDGKNEQDEKDDLNGVALRAGRAAGGGVVHGGVSENGRRQFFGQSRQSQRMVVGKSMEPCLPECPPSPNSN